MPWHLQGPSKLVGTCEKVEAKRWLRKFWTDRISRSGNSEQLSYAELVKDSKWKNNWVTSSADPEVVVLIPYLLHSSLTQFSESCVSGKVQTRHDDWGANTRESKNNLIVCDIICWFQISPGSLISIIWDDLATAHKTSATVADHIHLSGLWSKISLLLEEIKINIQYMLWFPNTDSE